MSRVVKSSLLGCIPIVFYLLLTPHVSLGQRAAIMGQVKGLDGKAVEGAVVRLENLQVKRRFELKTKKNGRYFHGAIPLGYYRYSLLINGVVKHSVARVRVAWTKYIGDTSAYDREPVTVDFDLQKIAEAKKQRLQMLANRTEAEKSAALEKEERALFGHMNEAFKKGRTLHRARRYKEAIAAFEEAARLDPRQHVIFANMGEIHRSLRKYDKALENYTQALKVLKKNPDDKIGAKYQMNLGVLLGLSGKTNEALKAIEKALELNPTNASQAYFNLGATLVNSGKAEGAAESFKKSVEANPNNANAQYQLAICLVSLASVTESGQTVPVKGTLEAFKKYVELAPTGPHAGQAKGMIEALNAQVETTYDAKKNR